MPKRRLLTMLAVPAAAAALLGGIPAIVASTTGSAGAAIVPAFRSLTTAQAAQLSQDATKPVIVVLKGQYSQALVDTPAAATRSAAVASSQASLMTELQTVHATNVKQYTLVDAVAATVSALEAKRIAASPAVAEVVPDQTFSVDPQTTAASPSGTATADRSTSLPLHNIPNACATTKSKAQLVPEGLSLTSTASGSSTAATARKLGFTGAGVKVAWIADGLDPKNVNFIRSNGKSVFVSYKDFSGDGPGSPTDGGEAFLDANTIAGQGLVAYNVNGFTAESYAKGCYVKIQGVAPGASLVGLDVFSGDPAHPYSTTTSDFVQAINYAVETAKVNVLNESFGGNTLPDSVTDLLKVFDTAAVKAGVTVSVSTGDSGTANTIGSPATDPSVISVGASTQFQAYAQSNISGTRYFASKGWLSDNVSALSSSGFEESGATVDLVAPGDSSWSSCDANTSKFAECTNLKVNSSGNFGASDIELAGGTSESAPFVSGAAALVIQAYRKGHSGKSPSPAVVKQILLSTATDLGVPAQEQGAGLLNTYQAVQLAESYGKSAHTGSTLLVSSNQINDTSAAGLTKSYKVAVTNMGTKTQTVKLSGRSLGGDTPVAAGSVTLNGSTSPQFTADSGQKEDYATFKFKVPSGRGRLDVSIGYAANPNTVGDPVGLTLYDPDGRLAADSVPQGVGNYGNVDVRKPAAGTWTAVAASFPASVGGYDGKVTWSAVTENFTSFGNVSPPSRTLAPGQKGEYLFTVTAPASAGDVAGAVVVNGSRAGTTSIPVTIRSLVNVGAGGKFTGVLTGGNGRSGPGGLATGSYYSFAVPSGTQAVRVEVALHNNPGIGNVIGAYLIAPDGNAVAYGQNYDLSGAEVGTTTADLTVSKLHPAAGTYTLILAFATPVAGTELTDPYAGDVAFSTAGSATPATPLPDGATLAAGKAVTIPVTITNNSNAPQDYFLDPRLAASETLSVAPVQFGTSAAFAAGSHTSKLPLSAEVSPSMYFVPSHTSSVTVEQFSTVKAMTDLSTATGGDPDFGPAGLSKSSLCAKSVKESYTPSGGIVTSGNWVAAPTECGPFNALVKPNGTATDEVLVKTLAFDPAVTVATGDFEELAVSAADGSAAVSKAVELQPGQSVKVNVTIKPTGKAGAKVTGTLYLDTLQSGVPPYGQVAGDEVAALPYSYTVG